MCEQLSPLTDSLILQEIFSHLNLRETKNIRLVCKYWKSEGALSFRRFSKPGQINIHLAPLYVTMGMVAEKYKEPSHTEAFIDKEREDLKNFLTTWKINHTLHISLLDFYPWQNFSFGVPSYIFLDYIPGRIFTPRWYRQGNNAAFAFRLIGNFFLDTCFFVNELRLEMSLKTEQDLEILEFFLEILESKITRVYLHLIMFPNKRLPVEKNHQRSKVKTLSLRLPGAGTLSTWVYEDVSPVLSVAGASTFFSLFPNLTFLDLNGLRQFYGPLQVKDKVSSFLSASQSLKHISGVRMMARLPQELDTLRFYSLAKPLRSLQLDLCHSYIKARACLQNILNIQQKSLESFDIIWRPEAEENCVPLLLRNKNKLKHLSITAQITNVDDGDYMDKVDVKVTNIFDLFNLREIFPQGILGELQSLSLILFRDAEVWDKIFPPENLPQFISTKLSSLVISLAGECESDVIQKFPRFLFPGLRIFRHGKLRDDGRLFVVCHHKYDGAGKLLGKWEWLGGVKHYLLVHNISVCMAYLYTAKYRMQRGLEFEEGFTDTAFHYENEQHWLTDEEIRKFNLKRGSFTEAYLS